jgi:hypothetical protein
VKPLPIAAAVLLVAGVVPILFTKWPEIVSVIGNGTLAAFVAFIVVGLVTGHLLGGPQATDRTVLALSTAARHPGVALPIAAANFPNQKLVLPGLTVLDRRCNPRDSLLEMAPAQHRGCYPGPRNWQAPRLNCWAPDAHIAKCSSNAHWRIPPASQTPTAPSPAGRHCRTNIMPATADGPAAESKFGVWTSERRPPLSVTHSSVRNNQPDVLHRRCTDATQCGRTFTTCFPDGVVRGPRSIQPRMEAPAQ